MKNGICLILSLMFAAGGVVAKPAMRDVAAIDDGILYLGIADEIRTQCPDIGARYFKALQYLYAIRDRARDLGYSQDEIDAYRKSDAEKARLRAKGETYLSQHGVSKNDPQSYCALGRMEIKKSSQIGALLKVK